MIHAPSVEADAPPAASPQAASRRASRKSVGWREAFFRAAGPGVVTGITMGAWLRLLAQNRFRIHPAYWPKAAFTTLASGLSSTFAVAEKAIYGRRIAATVVPPPLFVLGHWRSGTTHLHNLL
ncbi:MAG: sulfotransferase, partial [Planctomycetota bacterium]|nr:sulfotransferase [Planctomycetota bacterium]